jgi:RNase P/RNase MRP subunit POP5
MVLRRKDKHRYLLLYVNYEIYVHSKHPNNKAIPKSIAILRKRFYELFGSIELEKASINIILKNNLCLPNFYIIKCNLESMEKVLCAISLSYPPLTTIKISGTIKKLTSQLQFKNLQKIFN